MTLLAVEDLRVHFVSHDLRNRLRVARALNGVSFSVAEGEILGLVGESGSGKTVTGFSLLGLDDDCDCCLHQMSSFYSLLQWLGAHGPEASESNRGKNSEVNLVCMKIFLF